MTIKQSIVLITLLPSLAGCPQAPDAWTAQLDVQGPIVAGGEALWIDKTRGAVYALDPASSPPSVAHVAVSRNASFATPSATRALLLLLTPGRDAVRTSEQPEKPALTLVTPGTPGSGAAPAVTQRWELAAAFNRVAVAPDDRTAICYFSDDAATGDTYFRNPDELAIVDLTAAPSDSNPIYRSVRSLGATPLGVLYSPPLDVTGTGDLRRLAVVLATNALTFLDLEHLDRPEITVPLVAAGSSLQVTPAQVIFDASASTVYVRASGAADVYAIGFGPRTTTNAGDDDFLPHVNQPSAGRPSSDMMLFSDGTSRWLLTADGSSELTLINAATSDFSSITVGTAVDRILPVPADAPTRAVLYDAARPAPTVWFLDLPDLSTARESNLSRRDLAKPVHQLVPVPGDQQLLVVHDDARTVASILDLGPHRVDTPIEGEVPLGSFDFVGGADLVGVTRGDTHLGVLDLATLEPHDVRLDDDPQRVVTLGSHILVDHGRAEGLVTVLPGPDATRDQATVLWGFFLDGVLDQDLQDP